MKEFAEYLNDRFPKTRQQLERETGLEDRKVRKAISALKCQQPVLYSNTSRGYRLAKAPEGLNAEAIKHEMECAKTCLRDLKARKAVFTLQEKVYLTYLERCETVLAKEKKAPGNNTQKAF